MRSLFDALAVNNGIGPGRLAPRHGIQHRMEPLVRPSSPEMPRDAGRYQILGEIGRGGMGAVMKGRDPDLGRDLAVKVLLEEHRDAPDLVRRFIEEAQIGGQLQHPGIVPVYELGSFSDQRPYFTMKLVKGRTLAALLEERAGPGTDLPRFLGIFEQVCQTVAYAHARGVIHRDLKPSNIMVGSFGEVQVMDWGLAKVLPQGGRPMSHGTKSRSRPSATSAQCAPDPTPTPRDTDWPWAHRRTWPRSKPAATSIRSTKGRMSSGWARSSARFSPGRPAYRGPSREAIHRKAIRGDTSDALGANRCLRSGCRAGGAGPPMPGDGA